MKVGDLVKYKHCPENPRYGIILKKDEDRLTYYNLLIYWINKDPRYNNHVWERKGVLEVISESR